MCACVCACIFLCMCACGRDEGLLFQLALFIDIILFSSISSSFHRYLPLFIDIFLFSSISFPLQALTNALQSPLACTSGGYLAAIARVKPTIDIKVLAFRLVVPIACDDKVDISVLFFCICVHNFGYLWLISGIYEPFWTSVTDFGHF